MPLPRLDTLIPGQHSRREILEAKSASSASTVQVEVEGRKGDTTLTGADELYHDEAFRAKASPFQPILNVNNFFEISICKPENFLTGADGTYNDEAFRAKTGPHFQLVSSPAELTAIP